MLNLAIALGFLAVGMYVCVRIVDWATSRFNLFPNRDKVTDTGFNGIYLPEDFNLDISPASQAVSNCEVEAVCSQVAENSEGLVEGVSATAEAVVGSIADVIDGL